MRFYAVLSILDCNARGARFMWCAHWPRNLYGRRLRLAKVGWVRWLEWGGWQARRTHRIVFESMSNILLSINIQYYKVHAGRREFCKSLIQFGSFSNRFSFSFHVKETKPKHTNTNIRKKLNYPMREKRQKWWITCNERCVFCSAAAMRWRTCGKGVVPQTGHAAHKRTHADAFALAHIHAYIYYKWRVHTLQARVRDIIYVRWRREAGELIQPSWALAAALKRVV